MAASLVFAQIPFNVHTAYAAEDEEEEGEEEEGAGEEGDNEIPEGTSDGTFVHYPYSDDDYSGEFISGYEGSKSGPLEIPSDFDGVSVVGISSGVFKDCSGFTGNLKLPSTLKCIEKSAFSGCSGFTGDLALPDGIVDVEESAFSGCSGFNGTLTIPASIEYIDETTFNGLYNISRIVNNSEDASMEVGQFINNKTDYFESSSGKKLFKDGDDDIEKGIYTRKIGITSVTITQSSPVTVNKDKTVDLTATVAPANASDKSVKWTSSDTSVATVTSSGRVKAVKAGSATITVTAQGGNEKSASIKVNVPGVSLNTSNLTIARGTTSSAVKATLIDDTISKVTSSSEGVATAKVKSKTTIQITGVSDGTATITVVSKGGSKATVKVTVQSDKVTTKKLKLSKTKVSISGTGETATVAVTTTPDLLSTKEKIKVKSDKAKIASAKADQKTGKITITAKKKGKCNITVTVGSVSKKIAVTVKD